MSKRNIILLIIVLVVIMASILGFFYFYQPTNQNGDDTGGGTNFFVDFLPFGKSKNTTPTDETPPTDISGYEPTETDITDLILKKVSSFPIAGYGVYMKERFKDEQIVAQAEQLDERGRLIKPIPPSTEFVPTLRYVNKITGNIYQTFADKMDERIFSSTTIPKVYEAYFGNKGESVIMRYLKESNDTIETFLRTLPKEVLGGDTTSSDEVRGSFLPENISDMSVSPDASKIFYLFNTGENAIGVTLSLSTNTKVQVFDSPFREWLSFWPNDKMITITTKPSSNVPGFMYAINPERKDFNKILGGINGLTTLTSPNGKLVLYGNNNLSLGIFDIDTGSSSFLGIKTLPEKCVWGMASDIIYCAVPKYTNQTGYPDSWYQGEVSFSDEIWEIDATSGNTTIILDPITIEGGEEVDAVKLNMDEGQNYLFFVNKKDSYLWELDIK